MERSSSGGSSAVGNDGDGTAEVKPLDWGFIYAELRYSLQYKTADIDDLTWQDYMDLCAYWKKHPPTHILAAAGIGFKPKPEIATDANQDLAIEQVMHLFAVKVVPKGELLDGRQTD